MRRSLAVVAGETAGHVYPPLVLASAYRAAFDDVGVLVLGTRDSAGARLAPELGYEMAYIQAGPLARASVVGKAVGAARALVGIGQARRLLARHGVRLVLGFGGFASGPALVAARSLGLATALHEANVFPGLTNRWLARHVDRAYLGYATAEAFFPRARRRVIGTPVRAELTDRCREPADPPAPGATARLLVLSGSRGSRFLARRIPELARLTAASGQPLTVLHQADDRDIETARAAYDTAGIDADVVPRLGDVADAYRSAHVAVARAGAGTLSELAVAGLPALLVPLADAAEQHQHDNARVFAESTGGRWVDEREWDAPALARWIGELLRDRARWRTVSDRSRQLGHADAAQWLVADCEGLMRGRW